MSLPRLDAEPAPSDQLVERTLKRCVVHVTALDAAEANEVTPGEGHPSRVVGADGKQADQKLGHVPETAPLGVPPGQ